MTDYLSSREVAELLGISNGTLQVWRHRGKIDIPYEKVGRAVLYKIKDVEKYIKEHSL